MLKIENSTAQTIIQRYRIHAQNLGVNPINPSKRDLAYAQALYDIAKVCEDTIKVSKSLCLNRIEIIISDELISNLAKYS